jgi:hypothetical protein
MQLNTQVGPQTNAVGATPALRSGNAGDGIFSELNARYYENTYRGNTFFLDSDSVTLAAANTTKTALGTAKFINGFYNPVGSGKNAVILTSLISVVSGTVTGPFVYNYLTGVVSTSASTGTIRSGLLAATANTVVIPQVGVILNSAVPSATTALQQLATLGGPFAVVPTAVGSPAVNTVEEEVAGRIIVPPGCFFGLMQIGASTAIVQSTLSWAEVAI